MKNFTPILLIVISVAIFFIFIDPQYKQVQDLLVEKEENATMLELAAELSRKREQLHNDFNNISPNDKEDLHKLLPSTVDNVRLILDMNNIAESFGLQMTAIGVSGGTEENSSSDSGSPIDSIGTISLSFSVTAPYELFIELLRDLEESLRVVDIRSLSVSTGGQQEEGVDDIFYSYSVTLDTYWLR